MWDVGLSLGFGSGIGGCTGVEVEVWSEEGLGAWTLGRNPGGFSVQKAFSGYF